MMTAMAGVEWGAAVGVLPYKEYAFPQAPGVYVFAQRGGGKAHVRYVGQASNLDDRIAAHVGGHGGNKCLWGVLRDKSGVVVRAAVQRGEVRRVNLEHTCYIYYSMHGHRLCNANEPEGEFWEGVALPF